MAICAGAAFACWEALGAAGAFGVVALATFCTGTGLGRAAGTGPTTPASAAGADSAVAAACCSSCFCSWASSSSMRCRRCSNSVLSGPAGGLGASAGGVDSGAGAAAATVIADAADSVPAAGVCSTGSPSRDEPKSVAALMGSGAGTNPEKSPSMSADASDKRGSTGSTWGSADAITSAGTLGRLVPSRSGTVVLGQKLRYASTQMPRLAPPRTQRRTTLLPSSPWRWSFARGMGFAAWPAALPAAAA